MAEPYNPYAGQTLSPYEPTWRDRLASMLLGEQPSFDKRRSIEGLLGSSGLGDTGMSLVDFTGLGGLLDAQTQAAAGDYRSAAMAMMPGMKQAKAVVKPLEKIAYHAAYEPFAEYNWKKLGQTTEQNTTGGDTGNWAMNLARLGPWAHEVPLSKRLGASYDLPVEIRGSEKQFKSIDALQNSIEKNGGPEKFREKLLSDGFGHISVVDEEFGNKKSFIGLSPENFRIKQTGNP